MVCMKFAESSPGFRVLCCIQSVISLQFGWMSICGVIVIIGLFDLTWPLIYIPRRLGLCFWRGTIFSVIV